MSLPELPDGLTEEQFEATMAGLMEIMGAVDAVTVDIPGTDVMLLAVEHYNAMAHVADLRDPYASAMVRIAAATVSSMRMVVDSMYEDVLLTAESITFEDPNGEPQAG